MSYKGITTRYGLMQDFPNKHQNSIWKFYFPKILPRNLNEGLMSNKGIGDELIVTSRDRINNTFMVIRPKKLIRFI